MDEENENLEEQAQKEPASSEQLPVEMEMEPPKEKVNVQADKIALKLLLGKYKIVIIVGGIILATMILVIFMTIVNEATGNSEPYYKEGLCKTVTVNYEPYNENETSYSLQMDMETYVKSAAVEYIKDIQEHENESGIFQVYYALTIALRTEAVASNCKVTYRDKKLSKNTETVPYLDTVLQESKGIILGDQNNNVISNADVSDFCWYEKNSEEYKIYPKDTLKISRDFVNNYVANDIYSYCPCNDPKGDYTDATWEKCWTTWPKKDDEGNVIKDDKGNDIIEAAWLHEDETTGFSVVGAYNLMRYNVETGDENGYDYNLILRYFYGQNIKYMTMDKETAKNDLPTQKCSSEAMPYDATPLDREAFISAVTNFLSSGSYASWTQDFITHAGDIYDMGLDKKINPELIYIIARKETSFKANNNDTAKKNYYGYGHGNEDGSGSGFATFMDGVESLYNWISRRDDIDAVITGYSSLGEWLYNFDPDKESGLGGCYYMKKIYGNDYSRCSSSYYCAAQYGSSGQVVGRSDSCIRTTEEEKNAYHEWQRKQYLAHRKDIFNLSGTVCIGSNIETDANTDIPDSMMKEPLGDFLTKNGLSLQDLNDTIYDNVVSKGVGTRAGVATAATTLINYMQQFNVRIPYTYGGGHGAIKGVGRATANLFGADPQWGTPIGSYSVSCKDGTCGPYTHYGPDCSAFVYWALHNGGLKVSFGGSTNMKYYGTNHNMDGSYIAQVGDVLVSTGHVVLVVAVNEEEQTYITAESNGLSAPYTPDTKGISYRKMAFVDKSYVIVDMSSYYDEDAKHYSVEEYTNAFNNGRLG